jgi:hypothetical protein
MKPKLLVAGAILATLAVVAARTRLGTEPVRPAAAPQAVAKPAPADVKNPPALGSYRVFEEPVMEEGSLPYRGATYSAEVSRDGLSFQAGEHKMSLRARRVEQGGTTIDLSDADPVKSRFAATSIARAEGVVEEFVFENRRAEHLVRLDRPIGEGAVTVRVAVETSLKGQVQQVRRGDSSWKDTTVSDGGLVFTDYSGKPGLAYHGAMAIDAAGRRQLFDPRWENGEIALEVPAAFMKDAAYPVVIDPWLELNFSGSGGGISATGTVSESPSINLIGFGGNPCVAWADASDGDFDIYFRYWNGFEWSELGTSASPGGVSANASKSTNPSIGNMQPTGTGFFHPFIVWEDDLSGTTNIFMKFWTGTAWSALGGSATSSGLSLSIGTPCKNPQAIGVLGLIDNDNTGTVLDRFETFPVVVYEIEGIGIASEFFYPGDNQGFPAAWYDHPSGFFIAQNSSAARPSVTLDSQNNLVVAYEQSTGTEYDILASISSAGGVPYVGGAFFANWAVMGNASAGTPGGLSVQPAVAVDVNDDIWVAWRESVGAESEIYVARSSGGAFSSVAGSASGTGISSTSVVGVLTSSNFPTIAIDKLRTPVQPVVAWEDDAGGNLDIHLRRLNTTSTAWDSVADEGSAFPGNLGGISRTPSFSLRPKAVVAPDGTITVAWRDGTAGSFDLLVRRYHDNFPSNLTQQAVNGLTLGALAVGGTSITTTVQFSSVILAETASLPTNLRLQLEIRPSTSVFTGQPTHESLEVATGGTATVVFTGLPNVNYHWRARSMDAQGRGSPWVSFGGNADGEIDFRIDSTATGSGSSNNILGTSPPVHKDKCGLVGLEAFALIALAAFARRRRMSNA